MSNFDGSAKRPLFPAMWTCFREELHNGTLQIQQQQMSDLHAGPKRSS
jgi:hypothetical protein